MSKCEAIGDCPNKAAWRPVIRLIMKPALGHYGRPRNQDMEFNVKSCSQHTHNWHLSDFWSDKLLDVAKIVFRGAGAKEPVKEDAQLVWIPLGQGIFDKKPELGETK